MPVDVVGTATTFPGTSSDSPSAARGGRGPRSPRRSEGRPDPLATPRATTEVWVHGPADGVLDTMDELGVLPQLVLTAEEVQDIPFIDAAVQTFLVLQVLGIAAVVSLIAVAVVYLLRDSAAEGARPCCPTAWACPVRHDACGVGRRAGCDAGRIVRRRAIAGRSLSSVARRAEHRSAPVDPPGPVDRRAGGALLVTAVGLVAAAVVGGAMADRGARASSDGGGDARCRVSRPCGSRGSCAPIEPPPARCGRCATSPRRSRAAACRSSSAPPAAASHRCCGSSRGSIVPRAGSIDVMGVEIGHASSRARRAVRRSTVGYVFQRPSDNFVGHLTVGQHLRLAAGTDRRETRT